MQYAVNFLTENTLRPRDWQSQTVTCSLVVIM